MQSHENQNEKKNKLSVAELRQRLEGKQGEEFYKGLEQMADSEEFQRWVADEFPNRAKTSDIDRRSFLKFMGASMALAGMTSTGCRSLFMETNPKIVPFVRAPEDHIPGLPNYYATAASKGGYLEGMLVTAYDGRPTKLDGNPAFPSNLGSSNAQMQAEVLGLYDPDRLTSVQMMGDIGAWSEFRDEMRERLSELDAEGGRGLVLLTETVGSPTEAAQMEQIQERFPNARWFQYEPVNRDNVRRGAIQALGRELDTIYDFRQADVVLSLDAQVFDGVPGSLRYQRDVMAGRKVSPERPEMNRLYAVESAPTLFGAVADHRKRLRASEMTRFCMALAQKLGVPGASRSTLESGVDEAWLDALVEDLRENRGRSVVIPGDHLPPDAHVLCHSINHHLRNAGRTVKHIEPVLPKPVDHNAQIRELAEMIYQGDVKMLLMSGANPAYSAPADLNFGEKIEMLTSEGAFTASLSLHDDETAHLCRWRLPKKHFLEAWSDGFGYDGTAAIQQPLIERMYDGLSPLEFFSMVLGLQETDYDLVRRYWARRLNGQTPRPETAEDEPGIVMPDEVSDTQIDRLQTELDEIQSRLAELNQAEFDSGSIEEQLRTGNLASLRTERSALLDQITALGLVVSEEDVIARPQNEETVAESEEAPAEPRSDREFENLWRVALAKGLFEDTAAEPVDVNVMPGAAAGINLQPPAEGLEAVFAPDPALYDGRYANNGWLQEMPKPLTQLTWDNAVFMSARTAEELGLELDFDRGDYPVVRVSVNGREVEAAAMINMGMADNVLLLHLGHGRWRAGQMGSSPGSYAAGRAMFHERADRGGGFNFYQIRTSASPSIATGVSLATTDEYYPLALAQVHHTIDVEKIDSGRHLIQPRTLEQYNNVTPLMHQYHWEEHGEHGGDHGEDHLENGHAGNGAVSTEIARGNSQSDPPSLYPEDQHDFSERAYQWAMTIDLNLCTGCSACVVACQAENNIPVVGKREVKVGREMHWLRIDRYYGPSVQQYQKEGDKKYLNIDDPQLYFQPLACVHCENAPCEPVCPVAATIHNHEGVNQMIYNRCVGTRYCSNNCPYKVRRFNYLNYANIHDVPVLKLLHNPNVTVRGRGVMEKCTYCVQRINKARIEAKKDGRQIQDGEVITACQQACPSEAILFGDIRDTNSAVYKAKQDKRNYLLLEDLNTRPRTSHLTKLFNPNPRIEA